MEDIFFLSHYMIGVSVYIKQHYVFCFQQMPRCIHVPAVLSRSVNIRLWRKCRLRHRITLSYNVPVEAKITMIKYNFEVYGETNLK